SSSAKSPSTPCCTHPTRVGAGRLSFWCSSARVACGCPSAVMVPSRLTLRTCVPHNPPLIVRAGGSCPRVFVTLRLLSGGSCRRAFRIHLGCDRTSGSKLLQHALKACCEKITLWVFAGHWLRAPRTRGWTDGTGADYVRGVESPAHAGMDRSPTRRSVKSSREPRARGDGPVAVEHDPSFPARAPRTRGWTVAVGLVGGQLGESPAHAGMDRMCQLVVSWSHREPRARGDGPGYG